MARVPSSAIHSRSIRWSVVRVRPPSASFSSANRPGLDPLGQFDLLLGVEQRHLADLLQVVLDRVGGRARHGHLRGRQVIVVVAEDQDLLVLAAGVRGDLDHARAGLSGAAGLGVRLRAGLRLRPFERVHAFRVGVLRLQVVTGQVGGQVVGGQVVSGQVGGRRHVGQIRLVQVTLGERGLDVRVVRVEVAEFDLVVEIRRV